MRAQDGDDNASPSGQTPHDRPRAEEQIPLPAGMTEAREAQKVNHFNSGDGIPGRTQAASFHCCRCGAVYAIPHLTQLQLASARPIVQWGEKQQQHTGFSNNQQPSTFAQYPGPFQVFPNSDVPTYIGGPPQSRMHQVPLGAPVSYYGESTPRPQIASWSRSAGHSFLGDNVSTSHGLPPLQQGRGVAPIPFRGPNQILPPLQTTAHATARGAQQTILASHPDQAHQERRPGPFPYR